LKTIHHVFDTTAPRDTVFAALTTARGLSGWWTTSVKAGAGAGAIAHFTFAGDFNPDMRVTARELSDDDYGTYNFNWGYYLESLRLFSTTGSGTPFQAGQRRHESP